MEKIRFNTLLSFSLILPINQKFSTLLIILSILLVAIDYRNSSIAFRKNFSKKYLPLVFLYIIFMISYFRDYFILDKNMFEQKASLLAFPLIFITISLSKQNIKHLLKFFVIGCGISYFFLLIMAFYNATDFSNFTFSMIQKEFIGTNSDMFQVNYFLGKLFANDFHITYLSVYFLLSIIVLFVFNEIFSKIIKYTFLSIFSLAILQMFSLFSVIILLLVLIYFIHQYLKIVLIVGVGALMLTSFFLKDTSLNFQNLLNLRPTIWKTSVDVIKENPLGYGVKTAQRELHNHYPKQGSFGAVSQKTKLDAHNAFLQVTIETGIVGFFLLLSNFYVLVSLKIKNSEFAKTSLFFTLIFILLSIIESSINIYMGISFLAFFSCLFIYLERLEELKLKV